MSKTLFYVYEHWRPDLDEPFYVGKGSGRRAHDMRRGRNKHHKHIQNKLARLGMCVEVRLVAEGLTEGESFALEVERIAFWKVAGVKLANRSLGGEGPSGLRHTEEWKRATSERMSARTVSQETKDKIADFHKGKKWGLGYKKTPEQIAKTVQANLGKRRTEETKQRLREIRLANPTFKGRSHSEEFKARLSAARKGVPLSGEHKAAMRKPKSAEHRQKLSEINKGKTIGAETRLLLSQKAKADWARRKAAKAEEIQAGFSDLPLFSQVKDN